MSLLSEILGFRGTVAGYQDIAREKITGPVKRKVEEQQAKFQEGRNQQAYGKAAAALNLNAPDIGAIALLARADPTAASSLLMQAAQARTPMGQQALANSQAQGYQTEQQMVIAAANEARNSQAFPLDQQARQQGLTMGGLQIQGQRLANQAAMAPPPMPTDAQIFEAETGYPLPKDYIAGLNPYNGKLEPIPAPNTAPALKATAEIDASERLSKTVTRVLALVDAAGATGTEMIGPKAGALRQAREDVITAYRERAALGTPTGGELGRIEAILPDPTSYGRNYYGGLVAGATLGFGADYMKQTLTAPYQDLLQTITADLDTKYKRNWWVPPSPGVRAP